MGLSEKNAKADYYLALFILFLFFILFFTTRFFLLKSNTLQRYEIYILKTMDGDANHIVKTFNDLKPKIKNSILSSDQTPSWTKLVSFSIVSNEEINITEIYDKISKQDKCKTEIMKVQFSKFNLEEWGRKNENGKVCKTFFLYEQKL